MLIFRWLAKIMAGNNWIFAQLTIPHAGERRVKVVIVDRSPGLKSDKDLKRHHCCTWWLVISLKVLKFSVSVYKIRKDFWIYQWNFVDIMINSFFKKWTLSQVENKLCQKLSYHKVILTKNGLLNIIQNWKKSQLILDVENSLTWKVRFLPSLTEF